MKRVGRGLVVLLVAGVELSSRRALAQEGANTDQEAKGAETPKVVIVPPKLMPKGPLPYPEGASGRAEVIVTLVVNADGSVREVKGAEGQEPFAAVAREEARRFRFEPARRGDVPVAATIRILVEFTPPVVVEAPSEEAPKEVPTAPKKTTAEVVEEIEVRGKKPPPTVVSLGRAEVRVLPGAFGDPFRAIDVLPGVTPVVSGLPYYYIRGAPPSNVGYFVDGVRIPYLFHFGLGPGVIHPAMLDRVDLYPGAYPAAWGRFAGGFVAGETKDPSKAFTGEANIRLFDAGALAEAPFANGRGHVLVGGRFSYTAAVLSLVVPELSIDYKDYNARVTYDLTPKDRLTLFTFGAADTAANIEDGEKQVLFASEFHRLDLRWDRKIENRTRTRVALTFGLDRTRLEGKRFTRDYLLGTRAEITHKATKDIEIRSGFQWTNDFFGTDLPDPYTLSQDEYESTKRFLAPHYDFALGAYADAVFKLPHGIELVPGARVDVFGAKGDVAPALDPRLVAKIPASKKTRFILANGLAHQPPAFAIPIPGFGVQGLPGGLQEAFQQSVGFEADLPFSMTAKANVFRHAYRNFGDLFAIRGGGDDLGDLSAGALNGRAYGLELLLRRDFKERFGFIASYTLSRNTRFSRGKEIVNGFDRPHLLNIAGSYNAGRGWRLGLRFLTYTGATRFEKTFADLYGKASDDGEGRAPDRLPAFYRLDLRIEKRWSWPNKRWISFILEGLNVTANKEVLGYHCSGLEACKEDAIGPVTVPSIGVEGGL